MALGHVTATVLDSYREWDVAGGLALAIEAGAVVLDRDGRPSPLPADGLLVAAPAVAAEVLTWWRTSSPAASPGVSAASSPGVSAVSYT